MRTEATLRTSNVAALNSPWGMAFLPDGRIIVTEKGGTGPGQIRIVSDTGQVSQPLSGVPAVDSRGQGGLLDVNIDPDFANNRLVYFSYTEPRGGATGTTVARARLNEAGTGLDQVTKIFEQTPTHNNTLHFGSRLVFDGEGHLWVTLGERFDPAQRQQSQDPNSLLGKVVRINPDGSIPAGNPYANGGGKPEVWSYGHRNMQAAAIHPETGALWTIEHGPRGGDELNKPLAGRNYGWPVITYGQDYSGQPIGSGITSQSGMEQPVYYWDPVIAPTGMVFYEGDMFPEWNGHILVGSLNPGGVIRLMLLDEKVVGEEALFSNLGRIRDVEVGPDGALWVLRDGASGGLTKVTR